MFKITGYLKEKRLIIASLIICLLIPAVLFGSVFLKIKQIGLVATLVVVLAICPFFLMFEHRKPKARELVLIAVMTAIAVAGRAAFMFLPQFKPILAVVIITGLAFGAEAGFMSGALSMLVSNFFFGMTAAVPWQMFCCGLCGFLAGALRRRRLLKHTVSICIYGFFSAYLYGAIADIWSVFSFVREFTPPAVLAVFISGIWFSTILAVATAFFLALLAGPMEKKLNRVKRKYGLGDTTGC